MSKIKTFFNALKIEKSKKKNPKLRQDLGKHPVVIICITTDL